MALNPFDLRQYQIRRAPPNPYDKSTVVSIFPRELLETKVTIFPGEFKIPAGSVESPGILVVGPSSWFRFIDDNQPPLEIPVSSVEVARSIVQDYLNSTLGSTVNIAGPGLFYVPGEVKDVKDLKLRFGAEITIAENRQNKWFENLVQMADVLWARSNGNPLSIPNDSRLGAERLGLKDKPWMKDFKTLSMKNCPACQVMVSPAAIICQNCKLILDQKAFDQLGMKVAG